MKKFCGVAFAVYLSISSTAVGQGQEHAKPKRRSVPDYLSALEVQAVEVNREVLPTVVTILTSKEVITEEGREEQTGVGSGALISPNGHVLTAAHVLTGAKETRVRTADGVLRTADLLFSESVADVAVMKLTEAVPELGYAKLGNSDQLAVGQRIYVVGSPYGLENSFSIGHISGFRDFNRLYDGTILAEFIQTDAAINSGNSGGPAFNSKGEIIGIASRILSLSGGFEGLGFVVAINTVRQLIALEDRVWIGVDGIYMSREQLAAMLNVDQQGGLLVQSVVKDGPADRAGLRGGSLPAKISGHEILLGGDLILAFDSQQACHSECLMAARKRLRGLDRIPVKFLRGGKLMQTVIDASSSRRDFLEGALQQR